ncbi:RluA family pseudouridine synthase [Fodinibius sediminis]|uniref:23S rRNA pseudouridine1911/1915/1917 synthase n=1 Tax=Fodinibius sediminis TaxID=1214077 RepID=A0A521AGF0_9BACT|nr:RluA family pseudouridine synthase [Fodinibius sediminis]SMO33881.1 23S rRNA pseudouridine1911/1915/1917 synthase [Fodinibius sediminis]
MASKKRPFYIVHQDKDIFVVDKPAGLLAVPIPDSNVKNLFDLVADHLAKHGVRVGTVHRIDRYTSGLMVFAKNKRAYDDLYQKFRNHEPRRTYLAMVRGIVEKDEGTLEHHLKLIKKGFRNIVVDPEEKGATPARLRYRVKERFQSTTLVEIQLDTGLKNQIRVQFEHIGHQLVGDQHYAPEEKKEQLINRQALHAYRLEFQHPRKNRMVRFEAKIPADMLRLVDHYRWQQETHS